MTTNDNTAPIAGWYPSQTNPNTEAYWDGNTWTGHTRATTPIAPPPGTTAGTGAYAGNYWDGKRWLGTTGTTQTTRSTGRTIGGIVALAVAALVAYLGYGWFQGFNDLTAEGNEFAGILGLFGTGAIVVAAAFGIWGVVLLSKK